MGDETGGHFNNSDSRHVHRMTPQGNQQNHANLGTPIQETDGPLDVTDTDDFSILNGADMHGVLRQTTSGNTRNTSTAAQELECFQEPTGVTPTDSNFEEIEKNCQNSFRTNNGLVCSQQKVTELSKELLYYLEAMSLAAENLGGADTGLQQEYSVGQGLDYPPEQPEHLREHLSFQENTNYYLTATSFANETSTSGETNNLVARGQDSSPSLPPNIELLQSMHVGTNPQSTEIKGPAADNISGNNYDVTTPAAPLSRSATNAEARALSCDDKRQVRIVMDMGFKEEIIMRTIHIFGPKMLMTDMYRFLDQIDEVKKIQVTADISKKPVNLELCSICGREKNNAILHDCGCLTCSKCAPTHVPAKCKICSRNVTKVTPFDPHIRKC